MNFNKRLESGYADFVMTSNHKSNGRCVYPLTKRCRFQHLFLFLSAFTSAQKENASWFVEKQLISSTVPVYKTVIGMSKIEVA